MTHPALPLTLPRGVVLRALLFVHVTLAVGVSFAAIDIKSWITLVAVGASMALPGVLLWLVVACLLKRPLARLAPAAQWVAAVILGGVAGGFGWGLQAAGGLGLLGGGVVWVAPVLTGAVLAAALFYWLTLRARARLPADTTARLAELQSRIRPHFLFNTLNTAITLARLTRRAPRTCSKTGRALRVALNESGESVSLADEVALAKRYLAIEQVRFGSACR